MPRWKATEQIINLARDGEVFDENWMNYDSIFQYMPAATPWNEKRAPRVDEIYIWEVISEASNGNGFIGVYGAWQPYAELYVVTHKWRIVQEFSGWRANQRLEKFLVKHQIPYPKTIDTATPDYEPDRLILSLG